MGKVVPLVILLIVVGVPLLFLVLSAIVNKARRPAPRIVHRQPDLSEWRSRLDQLHFLLVQVMSSDQTLTHLPSLPQETADKLSRYFGKSRQPPHVTDRRLVDRVTLLEDYLAEVLRAHRAHPGLSALPRQLVSDLEQYDYQRQRRLES